MKRIRMLQTLGTGRGMYLIGKSYRVPEQVDQKNAESWVKTGHAEEDKSLDAAPETKEKKKKAK